MELFNKKTVDVSIRDAMKALPEGKNEGEIIIGVGDSGEQRVRITSMPSNLKGSISLFICPVCGKKTRKLFLNDDMSFFMCRQCCGIKYSTQTDYRLRKTPYQKKVAMGKEPAPKQEDPKKKLQEFIRKRGLL